MKHVLVRGLMLLLFLVLPLLPPLVLMLLLSDMDVGAALTALIPLQLS